jgi:hypothetical protein
VENDSAAAAVITAISVSFEAPDETCVTFAYTIAFGVVALVASMSNTRSLSRHIFRTGEVIVVVSALLK